VSRECSDHPACPSRIPADANSPWPAHDLWTFSSALLLNDSAAWDSPISLPKGAWNRPPAQSAVVPIRQQGHERPAGFLVVGINPYRRYDASYEGFVDLVSGQIAAGIASARAYDEERRRAESLAQLDHAKTQFFSNVSHEFRTPLTLMLAPLEDRLANPAAKAGGTDRKTLALVHRNGLRLLRLVNSLLDFSRIEAGRMKARYVPSDLARLTSELASNFRSAAERAGLRLTIDCPKLPEPVYVDREMWEKIVFNLLSNALKFTFDGGITVQLRAIENAAELRVVDTGNGIPEQELAHVFERFHRVEGARARTFEGSGIGLALVQDLVRLHGGLVRVESKLGEGSSFIVSLPFGGDHLPAGQVGGPVSAGVSTAVPAEAYVEEAVRWLPEMPQLNRPASAAGNGNREIPEAERQTVLVADDNLDMREYVRSLLAEKYTVLCAANGDQALSLARSWNPGLVLSDVMMPGLDGFGLLRALRDDPATRTTAVILLSARAGEESRSEGMDAGADDYIVKPFGARELLARVGAHLRLARIRSDSEAAMRESEERLQQAFAQAPVGVAILRGDCFTIELANPEYQKFFPDRSLIGRKFHEAVPEASEAWIEALNTTFRSAEPFIGNEYRIQLDRDGDGFPEDCWFTFVYQPLKEANGEVSGVVIVSVDVSTHVRARQGLERANRELEEFAYVSSHDLQEPLRMVNIYTHLLLKALAPDSAETAEYAAFVRQGVQRMEHLIRDLLSYSRVIHSEGAPAGTADLADSLSQAMQTLKTRIDDAHAGIAVGALPKVRGEAAQIAHVFQNLITNSLKYRRPETDPEIHIEAERAGSQWIISVCDNGIGFEQQYAERIFGLFKRLHKDEYPGTGLGLAICQRIVERFGGRMWAEGRPGQGATLYFTLNAAESK
jgi:PAS domain S-box-containing protein